MSLCNSEPNRMRCIDGLWPKIATIGNRHLTQNVRGKYEDPLVRHLVLSKRFWHTSPLCVSARSCTEQKLWFLFGRESSDGDSGRENDNRGKTRWNWRENNMRGRKGRREGVSNIYAFVVDASSSSLPKEEASEKNRPKTNSLHYITSIVRVKL